MTEDEQAQLKKRIREDRALIAKAEAALAQINRGDGLSDEHADVLAALRLRLEGKPRKSLEDLLTAAGDISGKRDLGEVLDRGNEGDSAEWPAIEDKKRDWPGG